MTRPSLYPEIKPFASGFLTRDGGHRIYWEQSGNPNGVPVVFLHGGPGAGFGPSYARFFDPSHYRIIAFDQRGAGRSEPHAEIKNNTTGHLVADVEALRDMVAVDQWLVFGGSWGATLALAYAVQHPERCKGFILRGIFMGSMEEADWFLYGMRKFFPEAWRSFSGFLPEIQCDDLLAAYHERLCHTDPAVHLPAAHAWMNYEISCSTLKPGMTGLGAYSKVADRTALGLARISTHYFSNAFYLKDSPILDNLQRFEHLPAIIVQGRYDVVCPIETAESLATAWKESQLVIVPDAGHSALEPGIRAGLVAATERFKRL